MVRFMSRLLCYACGVLAAALVSGCALPYYWQAIGGQIELLHKREPIEKIVSDENRGAALREQLNTVAAIREFAVTTLELPDNESYTSYVDLGRPYVVWNVVAAPRFSVAPVQWCFPFAGCVSYRGYFDRADAEEFAQRLAERGYDTYSAGSSAYSTLGYFDDPVLNTMLGGDVVSLAGALFHELAHQKLYVQDDSELSEAFATAVEEHGVEAWIIEHGDAAALEQYRQRIRRRAEFAALIDALQARLQDIYAAQSDDATKLDGKAQAFATMQSEYLQFKQRWGGTSEYDGWLRGPLNNATLAAIATYRRWLPALKWQLQSTGVTQFYADVAALAELPEDERAARLEEWDRQSSATSRLTELREAR
jgi:predicted aminopeptidase